MEGHDWGDTLLGNFGEWGEGGAEDMRVVWNGVGWRDGGGGGEGEK